jgi:hypothetical protein
MDKNEALEFVSVQRDNNKYISVEEQENELKISLKNDRVVGADCLLINSENFARVG